MVYCTGIRGGLREERYYQISRLLLEPPNTVATDAINGSNIVEVINLRSYLVKHAEEYF